jgi:hypothetical protein
MQQIYIEYSKWEDYLAGMYNDSDVVDKDKKISDSIDLLSNPTEFYIICKEILTNWTNASDVNLSNKYQNRRAWLGAAACMYKHNCPEYLTRIAWGMLDSQTQFKANTIAEKIIKEYERKNSRIHKDMGEPMLF